MVVISCMLLLYDRIILCRLAVFSNVSAQNQNATGNIKANSIGRNSKTKIFINIFHRPRACRLIYAKYSDRSQSEGENRKKTKMKN